MAHDLGKTDVPVVWQTFRHKTEVYTYDRKTKTRHGPPNGCDPWGDRGCTGGYSVLPPKYIYTKAPEVPNCSGQPEFSVPAFVNLDETSQIGENEMFAGIVDPNKPITAEDHLIRFLAKTNKVAYDYVTHNGYYGKNRGPINTEKNNITNVVQANAAKSSYEGVAHVTGPAKTISFPVGSVEIKTGWRKLGSNDNQDTFLKSNVRYYKTENEEACYVESQNQNETWGMLALHIIQKTETYPDHFTFATFGHNMNIVDANGKALEDPSGKPLSSVKETEPCLSNTPASVQNGQFHPQIILPKTANCERPGSRLYYANNKKHPTPQGPGCFQNRWNPIPSKVQTVNVAVQAQLASYGPFAHYRLVSVQWKPFGYGSISTTNQDFDPAVYYLANEVVETNYNLQRFRGQLGRTNGWISDFGDPNQPNTAAGVKNRPYTNTFINDGQSQNWIAYNMGGCMGCHGVAQLFGGDFSFLLSAGGTAEPEGYEPDLYSIGLGKERAGY